MWVPVCSDSMERISLICSTAEHYLVGPDENAIEENAIEVQVFYFLGCIC